MAQEDRDDLYALGALGAVIFALSGDDTPPADENPRAVFSVDQDADKHYAYLDASASDDPDGSIVEYRWRPLVNGGAVDHAVKHGKQVTYTVDEDLNPGEYGIELRVTDEDGNTDVASKEPSFTLADPADNGGGGGGCSSDSDCPDGQECINGGCVPIDNGGGDVSVTIDSYSVDGGKLTASATGSGPIETWGWVLERDGSTVDQATGQSVLLDLDGAGSYALSVTVSDGGSNMDTDSVTFDYAPPKDQTITIAGVTNPQWVVYPEVNWVVTVSGELESSEGHTGWNAAGSVSGGDAVEINYSGDLLGIDWDGGPIEVHHNGSRVDPYSLDPTAGPRFREDYGGKMIEVTIRQTAQSWLDGGYNPSFAVANWLAGMLDAHNVSHDVIYDLPVIESPTERTSCHNPFLGNTVCPEDGCNAIACCDRDRAIPGTLYWWRDFAEGSTDTRDQWEAATGEDLNMVGDVVTLRKDSNCLLTAANAGGCGEAPGMFSISGAGFIGGSRPTYSPGTVTTSDWGDSVHDAVHEIAHNFGFQHPGNHDCSKGGGEAYIDAQGRWNRTPCVPGNPCENRCGYGIPDRSNVTSNTVVRHLRYTDCSIDQFLENTGSEQGQVQASPRVRMHRNRRSRRIDDCAECFDKDLDVPGVAERSNDCECHENCDGDCGCGGTDAPLRRRDVIEGGKTY